MNILRLMKWPLEELGLVGPWCKKVPLNADAHSTSASPAVAGSIATRQAPILDGLPLGIVRTFKPWPCLCQAKNAGSFDRTSCTGAMDGENFAAVIPPQRANPLNQFVEPRSTAVSRFC